MKEHLPLIFFPKYKTIMFAIEKYSFLIVVKKHVTLNLPSWSFLSV